MFTDTQVLLSAIWVALMLSFMLGDLVRLLSGTHKPGEIQGRKVSPGMWLGISLFMVIPILMIVLTLILPYTVNRWANIIVAGFFFLFNLVGLPTYPTTADKFLIAVGLVFNGMTIWYAWNWV